MSLKDSRVLEITACIQLVNWSVKGVRLVTIIRKWSLLSGCDFNLIIWINMSSELLRVYWIVGIIVLIR